MTWKSLVRVCNSVYLYSVVDSTLKKLFHLALRYRILHLCYWVYGFFSDLHLLKTNRPDEAHTIVNYIDAVNNVVWQMASVYFVILLLFPRFYIREKYGKFTGLALLTVVTGALLNILFQIGYVQLIMPTHSSISFALIMITYIAKVFDIFINTLLFFIVILGWHYFEKDQRNKKVERDHLLNELEFLKAQMNPHFVFNAINSIYVLMKIDTRASEDVLLRFSSLLRYQLYECGQGEAWLTKEIQFIRDYVELEKIRLGERYEVRMDIGDPKEYYRIAPFVLFPFVENAFKHISHHEHQINSVSINIRFNGNKIVFQMNNTIEENEKTGSTAGGIGLRNVRRRLELLYPGKHILTTGISNNTYHVHLEIELNENQMYHHR